MRKENRILLFFAKRGPVLCCLVLAAVVVLSMVVNVLSGKEGEISIGSSPSSAGGSGAEKDDPGEAVFTGAQAWGKEEEIQAVWVPFMTLDFSKESDQSEGAFREKFSSIIAGALEYDLNALIVHVHPFGDALYNSEYYPWSHLLTGVQGKDPGYDPLQIMVEMAHEAGLEIHAWMNPLRISIEGTPETLSPENPAMLWQGQEDKEDWIVTTDTGIFYNPAIDGVRQYIAEGAAEIAANYDVDGIHFDDYFYPTQSESFDQQQYAAYVEQAEGYGEVLSLQEWRCSNINTLVSLVYQKIKAADPSVVFGIAPQGNISNDMAMGADVRVWGSVRGYVDYLCPQLYVNFENEALPFADAAEEWKNLVTCPDVKLCLGLAVYKAGSDSDGGTWKESDTILAQQVSLGRELECSGFMLYSYDYLFSEQTKEEVQNVMKVLQEGA